MKRTVASFLLLLGLSPLAQADQHIKMVVSTGAAQTGARKTFDVASLLPGLMKSIFPETDYWISNDRLVQTITPPAPIKGQGVFVGSTTVVDLSQGTCLILVHNTKHYVAATLPLNAETLFADAARKLSPGDRSGGVTPNDLRRKIKNLACEGYTLSTDAEDDWASTKTVWATQALGVDADRLAKMLGALRVLGVFNIGSPPSRPEIKGFPLLWELESPTLKMTIEPVLVEQAPTPAALLAIPADYTRVDKLDVADLLDERNEGFKAMFRSKK
jgi:hypothetical protein